MSINYRCAGFGIADIQNATDAEIVQMVLSLMECYGTTAEIKEVYETNPEDKIR